MNINKNDIAVVVMNPQNDVLSEKGVFWDLVGKNVKLINFVTLMKKSVLLLALPISILANFSLKASADSTAGIVLSTKCRGGYNVNIWQNYTSGELLYRATSPNGNLSLGKGTSQATEGVRVYKFRSGIYQYWVWDGTLDNPQSGTLEVYKNNRILMKQACRKS
ncbi:MAG: hypothetical protein RMY64_06225 [Nostoc sp. DedQUE08]|uniref:hypothetical protein n=1 Tax=unclassified Nostoc TaxID=2593658 RepID=UPI002AD5B491|nr:MULTISPECIES: hypothetical protein [unclassified Nostoc]MDZ8065225.1 hypothetical protein [Nostoc sp. DedQUE08]MDZ8095867.1 hypothetical protein [Nostoc sp. DedQUE05]